MRLTALLLLAVSSLARADFVEADAPASELHLSHVGKVVFLAKPLPLEKSTARDFLKTYAWCEQCELDVRVFLRTSLVNELHALAPELTAEQLAAQGNYRVTFQVDGTTIYEEDLPAGAGSPAGKLRQTTFRVPLISVANEDSWGRFLWNRFMLRGGEDALADGTHQLEVELRPYVKHPTLEVGPLLAKGSLEVVVARPKVSEAQLAVQKRAPGSGFKLSAAQVDEAKLRELNRQIARRTIKDLTSLVVLKDGELLVEEYFNGATRETLQDTRSVGKSFASALTGLAIRDRALASVEVTLGSLYELEAFAHPSPAKEQVTIRQLLTMSSAFDGDDSDSDSPGNEENMYPTSDWVKFALDLPMSATRRPGVDWHYFTVGVLLLGDVLHRSVPGGLERYAEARLFKPLGIARHQWQYTPKKVVSTAGGLALRSLDLAKFGQLYANGGRWNGVQVLPEAWVKESLSEQVHRPDGGQYGYLFWTTEWTIGGRRVRAFNASGNGGNKIYVFDGLPLVVVVTAKAYNQPYAHAQVEKLMERLVLPAVLAE